jgi:hypothetical protein
VNDSTNQNYIHKEIIQKLFPSLFVMWHAEPLPGDSTTAVTREQLCGHDISPETRKHAIMEEISYVRSVLGLSKEIDCWVTPQQRGSEQY